MLTELRSIMMDPANHGQKEYARLVGEWKAFGYPDCTDDAPIVSHFRGTHEGLTGVRVVTGSGSWDLNPRLDIAKHSPTGFAWGYSGSGPAQLALAIMGSRAVAVDCYQRFKSEVIANMTRGKPWTIYTSDVDAWVAAFMADEPTAAIVATILGYAHKEGA